MIDHANDDFILIFYTIDVSESSQGCMKQEHIFTKETQLIKLKCLSCNQTSLILQEETSFPKMIKVPYESTRMIKRHLSKPTKRLFTYNAKLLVYLKKCHN